MAEYKIITAPNPILKQKAVAVETVDDALRAQMDGMVAAMYAAPGIGLAANQVAMLNRVFVMDLTPKDETEKNPVFMVNPEIVWRSEEPSVWEEGCLSIPGQYADVERPFAVTVRYLDYHGKPQEQTFEELGSHCVQHEIDHLDGVLFVDHLSVLKRNMLMKRYQKSQKNAETL